MPIVTSGLLLNLDSSNTGSYSGSGTTWSDISGNSYNATLPSSPNTPQFLNYFSFDGNDWSSIPYNVNLTPGTSVSIEGFAFLTNWNVTSSQTLFSNSYLGGIKLSLNHSSASGKLAFVFYVNGAFRNVGIDRSLVTSGWHHICGTFDQAGAKFYLDSVLIESIDFSVNTLPAQTCGPYSDQVVTGSVSGGSVWGSNPYTDDSDFNKAAVHAGLITAGQTATIRKTSWGSLTRFPSTTKNGITTSNWSSSWCGVYITLASDPAPPITIYHNYLTPIIIGGETLNSTTPTTNFWVGNINVIRMYNRALSSSEVLQNYNEVKDRFIVATTGNRVTKTDAFILDLVENQAPTTERVTQVQAFLLEDEKSTAPTTERVTQINSDIYINVDNEAPTTERVTQVQAHYIINENTQALTTARLTQLSVDVMVFGDEDPVVSNFFVHTSLF